MFLSQRRRRILFMDEVRGLCILLMIAYHGAFSLVYMFGVDIPAFHAPFLRDFLQPLVAGIFVLISGIASRHSRSGLKRGLLVLFCGFLITTATYFFMREQIILFGILHLLGVCMILQGILGGKPDSVRPQRLPAIPGVLLFLTIFAFTYNVPRGYLGILNTPLYISLPDALYTHAWLSPLGFPGAGFFTADYFPIIPWVFLFFAGGCLGWIFLSGSAPHFFYREHSRFLGAVGRRSLIIYLLHQPVLYGAFWAAFRLMEFTGIIGV